jgi:hypothetical protein
MIAFLLSVMHRKIVEGVVVDLSNVFNSLVNCVLATL